MDFSQQIISWYKNNKRDLPWRQTKDPYKIWLSEIILQQTRVNQGLPYYLRFIEKYPLISLLANAPEEEVMKLWQGLGYYSRARNMQATAKHIHQNLKGVFPGSYSEIIKLKGVGDYTASAIASFAFNEATPVIDGNANRVISRFFGVTDPIDSLEGKKRIKSIAEAIIYKKDPATFNQAIMEFGATQCTAQKPECSLCAVSHSCFAFQNKMQSELPVKIKKVKQRNRFFNYFVIDSGNQTFLQKRRGKDIWQELYEFPLLESSSNNPSKKIISEFIQKNFHDAKEIAFKSSPIYKHILSHQIIYARFFHLSDSTQFLTSKNLVTVDLEEVTKYPVPKLIENYITNSAIFSGDPLPKTD